MSKLNALDYKLISDTFSRPVYFANGFSYHLIDKLNKTSTILTDDDSKEKINFLVTKLMNLDGNVAKTNFVETNKHLFFELRNSIDKQRY